MSFNKCLVCKQPKGTCKHTSAVVAKAHAAGKIKKRAKKLWFGKNYGSSPWATSKIPTVAQAMKDAFHKNSGYGLIYGSQLNQAKGFPPYYVGFYTKPPGDPGPNPCKEIEIKSGDEVQVSWDLAFSDYSEGKVILKETPSNQINDNGMNIPKGLTPTLEQEIEQNLIEMKAMAASVNAMGMPTIMTAEEMQKLVEAWQKNQMGAYIPLQPIPSMGITGQEIQAGVITGDKIKSLTWDPETDPESYAYSRATKKTPESVELVISGLTPEEAEELMMKYKPAPKVLISKSVEKEAPRHSTKYQPICIWQTESSTKPAFGPAALYSTQLNTDGTLSCNCQGWTRGSAKNPNGRFCKHTKMYEDKAAEVFWKWQKGLPLGDEFQPMDEVAAKQYGQPAPSGEKLLVAKRVIEL